MEKSQTNARGNDIFGLLGVKFPEEYKYCDPVDICWVSLNPCIIKDGDTYRINRSHPYFDQIHMAIARTGVHWCDFMLYTFKGLLVDSGHWATLSDKLAALFCKHFLPAAVLSQSRCTTNVAKSSSS